MISPNRIKVLDDQNFDQQDQSDTEDEEEDEAMFVPSKRRRQNIQPPQHVQPQQPQEPIPAQQPQHSEPMEESDQEQDISFDFDSMTL